MKGNPLRILAIDPGNEESGYALIDSITYQPIAIGKKENHTLREMICGGQFSDVDHISIEMVKSYGMPVGATVFETCVWIGRFFQLFALAGIDPDLVYRADVKLHHCHSSAAKDSNVIVALTDRFASGVRNRGKGTIDAPGWFYGFKADIWQAYALAVYTADTINANDPWFVPMTSQDPLENPEAILTVAVDVPGVAARDAREVAS